MPPPPHPRDQTCGTSLSIITVISLLINSDHDSSYPFHLSPRSGGAIRPRPPGASSRSYLMTYPTPVR